MYIFQGSGTINIGGCNRHKVIKRLFPSPRWEIGQILFSKDQAVKYNRLEAIRIATILYNKFNGTVYYVYVDQLNELFNEDDLVEKATALQIISNNSYKANEDYKKWGTVCYSLFIPSKDC